MAIIVINHSYQVPQLSQSGLYQWDLPSALEAGVRLHFLESKLRERLMRLPKATVYQITAEMESMTLMLFLLLSSLSSAHCPGAGGFSPSHTAPGQAPPPGVPGAPVTLSHSCCRAQIWVTPSCPSFICKFLNNRHAVSRGSSLHKLRRTRVKLCL